MTEILFVSDYQERGKTPLFDQETVKNEPMLFSASADFARDRGGPITQLLLSPSLLPPDWVNSWDDLVIDTRVHMLMPGWYPCIPGWHLDDIPRTRKDGQPDHINPSYQAEHLLVNVGDCCPTMFLKGNVVLEDIPEGLLNTPEYPYASVYGKWHHDIEELLKGGDSQISTVEAPENTFIQFGHEGFHRGTQAKKNGWRYFLRATRGSQRKVHDEVRAQVQVYLPTPDEGW